MIRQFLSMNKKGCWGDNTRSHKLKTLSPIGRHAASQTGSSYENEVRSAEARSRRDKPPPRPFPYSHAARERLGKLAKAPTGVLARPWSGSHPWR
ncbi:hypothetical protein CSOJ01_13222 [Colletotrichum sojae]|uniref:Uncharacterized protein n=1 Tax=Colletotrichum sojae TaxID=2175907 RepID=A0A8H6ITT9_9PEZI|nr:hypothetical protein CSOJ01_13222 [Colletotrichum sojae]